jgi:hypothetical protein
MALAFMCKKNMCIKVMCLTITNNQLISNRIAILTVSLAIPLGLFAQAARDTVLSVPDKYYKAVTVKAAKYARRITNKTEKTLTKLTRWEGKIQALLEKASPKLTFAGMLEQYQRGQQVANSYGKQYDEYRDRLGNTMDYLSAQNVKAKEAGKQLKRLDSLVDNTEALQQFIKERKRQLIEQSIVAQ